MNKLCVFCGSSMGTNLNFSSEAKKLGRLMAENDIELIYGGGSIGLMGTLADSVLECGGRVTGVIPKFLYDKEVGHDGLTELHIVETMHERKMLMAKLAEGFIALPGGIGTMEEIFEIFTWNQLKLLKFPIAILNLEGYYNDLFLFMEKMKSEGFIRASTFNLLLHLNKTEDVIGKMKQWSVSANQSDLSKT